MNRFLFCAASLAALSALACKGDEKPAATTKKAVGAASKPAKAGGDPATQTLVVYSGRSEALVGPVLAAFDEANPSIKLDIRYNKTPALANQIKAEGAECPADVIWFQDSGYLGAFSEAKALAPLPQDILTRTPEQFRDPDGRWVGVTGRLRVLVYNTDKVKIADLPKSLEALADPKWKKRVGWAPQNASFQAHVSLLRHQWGEEKTKKWLTAMNANEPARYPKNSPQVKAAASGEIDIGWVNHYYLHKLKKPGYKAANYSFTKPGDAGNVLMLAGVAVREGSKNAELAGKLIRYLLDAKTQAEFAQKSYEYPVVAGVAVHPDVTAMDKLQLAPVNQRHLADVEPTLAMLQELGLN